MSISNKKWHKMLNRSANYKISKNQWNANKVYNSHKLLDKEKGYFKLIRT